MAGYYRCPTHGRFPITDVYPELAPDEAFLRMVDTLEAACPKCGVLCGQCKSCGSHGTSIEFVEQPKQELPQIQKPADMQLMHWDRWRITTGLHCPDCKPGEVCSTCHNDYSGLHYDLPD